MVMPTERIKAVYARLADCAPLWYRGYADGRVTVEVDGCEHALDPRLDLRNHSPTGFAWGYNGSGPAQLALAITADALGSDAVALAVYQAYKARVVAGLPGDRPWGPISDVAVRATVAQLLADGAA
ncbi:MAG TPA: DUF6166 domain-containing protein [Rhodanobacteraceae bacterium]